MNGLLDHSDKTSPTWAKLKKFYEKRLENLRKQNDNPKSSELDTAVRRGRIAECMAILALERELPPHHPDNPPDGA